MVLDVLFEHLELRAPGLIVGFDLVQFLDDHVGDVVLKRAETLKRMPDAATRHARLCELNVIEQAVNVCQTTVVQDAWDRGQSLSVHGWIYGLADGLVSDLGLDIADRAGIASSATAALNALGVDAA